MSIAAAIAVTGGVLFLASMLCGLIADDRRHPQPLAAIAWTLFTLSCLAFIAATWTAALT